MMTNKKKAARKAPAKTKQAKGKAARSAQSIVKTEPKAAQKGSMAEFMDSLVQRTTDAGKLKIELVKEAKRRGVKTPTLGVLRSHVKYRQRRGQLQNVVLPESGHAQKG